MSLSDAQNGAIRAWLLAKHELDQASNNEMEARKKLCATVWPGTLKLGANSLDCNGGKLTVTTGWNYSFDNADKVSAALQQIETGSADGPEIVAQLVNWKPNLLVKGYKELSIEHKAIIDKVLTTKPKTPSAKFESK